MYRKLLLVYKYNKKVVLERDIFCYILLYYAHIYLSSFSINQVYMHKETFDQIGTLNTSNQKFVNRFLISTFGNFININFNLDVQETRLIVTNIERSGLAEECDQIDCTFTSVEKQLALLIGLLRLL